LSTIQKAFVFIVLVLAVLSAAVQLVLFAQRDDWRSKYRQADAQIRDITSDLNAARAELEKVKADKSTAVSDLESQLASTRNELDDCRRELESAQADKANLESLVSTANAKLDIFGQRMDALAQRGEELSAAKQAAEEELAEVRAAWQDAEEQLVLASRKARDLEEKVASLEDELAERMDRIRKLEQEVEVLRQYYPGETMDVSPAATTEILGKITGVSDDRGTIYLSIGSQDGVENGMVLMVFKPDGTYVAEAKVFNVSGDKSAARILKPVYATVLEGDYVGNK